MNNKNTIMKAAFLLIAGCVSACQSNTTTGNTKPAENKTTNSVQTENKNAATPNDVPANTNQTNGSSSSKGSLATPTEAYKFAYAARKNKDMAGLKRVMSKDALEFLSIFSEPGEPIEKALTQMTETPQAATDESRNEKINGDKATLEYPDANGKWKTMDFIKEDGDWKITFPKDGKLEVESGIPTNKTKK